MAAYPNCPKCNSKYTYKDGSNFVCPKCAHKWSADVTKQKSDTLIVKDAHGNLLADG
ncbi:alkylphosphonate utilization protein, partial [Lysinibacillus agricola]